MYLLFHKKWENVVMTLELYRFYTIHCIYLIYSPKDCPLRVLTFYTKNVTLCMIMAKLPAAKVGYMYLKK